ncbi:DODA-type extradiol aromatic ring-opening family dioxygenase [Clostridium beijerinckii]|uniref:DODA-type extradiol aromatic ring-opening family dioxygenase n=1 Tax=Clostridium beijerinckii TaxID=1520 RepID=UPI00098C99FB|nr:class III extradiol ring-cleavage dioxygenase [Clostridium beijerinckii]NRT80910.1 4,5-DOPA dioxygenase extradiol [Clostridium beijerinckii]OOM42783.1 LigB family dioxygenase [Clostridium beijerinckii]
MIKPLFLAHGSPMMAIEQTVYTKFLNDLGGSINPKAIVVFTAHWTTETLTISASDSIYDTVYDFYGFPEELYKIKYPARGSSTIATKIKNKLIDSGIDVKTDLTRGLDHGAWTLLKHIYPKANIPVVQVSINYTLPIEQQIKIGTALKELGNEDILILGSGNTVHNLRLVDFDSKTIDSWSKEFDDWLIDKIENKDLNALNNYKKYAPHASLAVPTADHLVPLFIALGSSSELTPRVIFRDYQLGNLSYLCYEF